MGDTNTLKCNILPHKIKQIVSINILGFCEQVFLFTVVCKPSQKLILFEKCIIHM